MSNSIAEEHEGEQEFQPPPSHHPSAPPHESFDISTTVDPSYVISLIRKLLPSDVKDDEGATESGSIRGETKTESRKEDAINLPENGGEAEAMEFSENCGELDDPETRNDGRNRGGSAVERTWEECGCILWDLSASEDHAQFMVQNLILDVLLANLVVSQYSRITEISLGIIGNLACHEMPRKQIASKNELVRVIVEQLLLDDVPCLCEVCRVLTLCLQGSEGVIWAEALQSEQILSRILWIAENALNPQLLEKIVGLLLGVLESQQEVAAILIPPMLDLGFSSLLIKLLAFEMSMLKGKHIPDRYTVLDLVLRAIEALSTMDDYSQEICLNKELLQLVKELIELPDKFEGLFDVIPFASYDAEAQDAIWSTAARLLTLVKENEMSPSVFRFLVSIFASKLDLIEDELLVRPWDHEEKMSADTSSTKLDARDITMKRISNILTRWKSSNDSVKSAFSSMDDHCINEDDVDKLLDLLP